MALDDSKADLALLGVSPTYPSEKYGYIVPLKNIENKYIEVSHFKEKPTEVEARELISQEALWNCGVFSFKLEFIISLLQDKGIPIEYEELLRHYYELEKISFDYAVVEKIGKIIALPYNKKWKDLGTWNTLTEEMVSCQIGKGIISKDSTNTHLINELDIPVTILGIKNAVIAASPDGILVTDKAASPRVKEVLEGFDQRPMYEERHWGWYKVLDYTNFREGHEVLTKKICLKAGCNLSYQQHFDRNEVWTIINGEGEFALNDIIRPVKAGDVLVISNESKHGIKANTDLEIIEVQTGAQLIEEDVLRIFMTWEEIEKHCKENNIKSSK
jgi:mannose-1-phosphate guanylyltransferase